MLTLEPESNLRPGDEVALTCVAYGGYPEGNVIWQDGSGHNLTDNITLSVVANEKGLFTVTSVLSVVLEPNSTYSCRIINPLLGEEGFVFATITGERICNILIHFFMKLTMSPQVVYKNFDQQLAYILCFIKLIFFYINNSKLVFILKRFSLFLALSMQRK